MTENPYRTDARRLRVCVFACSREVWKGVYLPSVVKAAHVLIPMI